MILLGATGLISGLVASTPIILYFLLFPYSVERGPCQNDGRLWMGCRNANSLVRAILLLAGSNCWSYGIPCDTLSLTKNWEIKRN